MRRITDTAGYDESRRAFTEKMSAAYKRGRQNGFDAVENCEVGEDETLAEAAFRAEQNARQYAGHIPTEIQRDDILFDQYQDGVDAAIRQAT